MQAASDLFLGWTHDETSGVDYYWRNLRDMKESADINAQPTNTFMATRSCVAQPWPTPTPDPATSAAISGYLGKGNAFGKALSHFAISYADQNDLDHAALVQAITDGQLPAESNV